MYFLQFLFFFIFLGIFFFSNFFLFSIRINLPIIWLSFFFLLLSILSNLITQVLYDFSLSYNLPLIRKFLLLHFYDFFFFYTFIILHFTFLKSLTHSFHFVSSSTIFLIVQLNYWIHLIKIEFLLRNAQIFFLNLMKLCLI